MLVFGQILNAGVCLSVYVLAAHWTGRPVAGIAAMLVPGTLSLMPAYYVTWGRYTQLDGLVILPIAMLTLQAAVESRSRRDLVLAGVLAGGLLLVHYRVAYFLATFAAAYLIWHTGAPMRRRQSVCPIWRRALAVAGVAVAVSAPWVWRLLDSVVLPLDTFLTRVTGNVEYNSVPWDLLTGGNSSWLFLVSVLGVVLAIWQRRSQVFIILL
jgi:Dolichyl-phosphate-mannose-protein mannosyltransferase